MQLPFTVEQFYGVFSQYNTAVWPVQMLLLALAVTAIVLVGVVRRWSGVAVSAILAFLWAWLGLAYHLAFFTAINPMAYVFSAVSLAGAFIFFWQGVIRRKLVFKWTAGLRSVIGLALVMFALVIYPAWSVYAGHRYPGLPTFGLPCPTTLFTIGLLAFLVAPYPRSPLVVPVLWCLVGAQAAFFLGVMPDLGLIVAALVGMVLFAKPGGVAAHGSARPVQ